MAQPEQPSDRAPRVPVNIIDLVNKVVRTSRQMLLEIGREPTVEELAAKLGLSLEKVRRLLEIARRPILMETPPGNLP
jgi:RNA polymerase primary sigma factor